MHCSACNLQYSEPLKYCKQCGRQLVQQMEESAASGRCCTRCGARAVSTENFCQQCGARLKVRSEDTTIGTCVGCGTPWRSAWLYCRSCGTDRDHALQFKSAPALPEHTVPTLTMEAVSADSVETPETNPGIDVKEIAGDLFGAKAHCRSCGTEALRDAQFCEFCGGSLTLATTETQGETPRKVEPFKPAGEEIVPRRQTDRIPSTPADYYLNDFESEITVQERGVNARLPARTSLIDEARSTSNIKRKIVSAEPSTEDDLGEIDVSWPSRTTRGGLSAGSAGSTSGNRRTVRQPVMIAICLAVLAALIALILWQRAQQRQTPVVVVTPSPEDKADNAAASPTPSPATNSPSAPAGMIYIAGGSFRLGRDDGDEYERPAHEVKIAAFYMDRTEVTNEQYLRFVEESGRARPPHWRGEQYPNGQANFPVVNVSWEDANAYARWAGKRLPTEEEWEYAARGSEGRLYPWGNEWSDSLANTRESERGRIVAVGSFPAGASPLGLLDLVGNVWEWTASDLRSYAGGGQILAPGKVIRGGAYDVAHERANATYRGVVQPERTYDKTGFRCVKPAP